MTTGGTVTAAATTLVVLNPVSGAGRALHHWPAVADALRRPGMDLQVHHTTAPGDATTATREALRAGVERILAFGGDGTINEVVNGFFDEQTGEPIAPQATLGIIPGGTGGDFRKSIDLPDKPVAAAAALAAATVRRVDVGRIDYDDAATQRRFFINIADCGIGGEVVARVNRSRHKGGGLRGTAVFLGVSLSELLTFQRRPVRVILDGEGIEAEVQNVVIANGRWFGGGMQIAPDAAVDDGLLDVVILEVGRVRAIRSMPSLYRGRHIGKAGVRLVRAREVRVEPLDARPLLFDVEGEQHGAAPATLRCVPGALRLLVPGSAQPV